MALGEYGMKVDLDTAQGNFETAVNNSQALMALRYLTGVVDKINNRLDELEAQVAELSTPKKTTASRSKKTTSKSSDEE